MKYFSLLTLFIFSLALVSCGGDKGKSSSGTFSNSLSTQTGYYNPQTGVLEVGNQSYPPNQQYATVMNQAISQAQAQNIQPRLVNGVYKFRARITAQMMNYNTGYNTGYNSNYNSNYNTGTLNISSVVFY